MALSGVKGALVPPLHSNQARRAAPQRRLHLQARPIEHESLQNLPVNSAILAAAAVAGAAVSPSKRGGSPRQVEAAGLTARAATMQSPVGFVPSKKDGHDDPQSSKALWGFGRLVLAGFMLHALYSSAISQDPSELQITALAFCAASAAQGILRRR